MNDDTHTCTPDAHLYWCPTANQIESSCHGGFDTCCAYPELHQRITPTVPTGPNNFDYRLFDTRRISLAAPTGTPAPEHTEAVHAIILTARRDRLARTRAHIRQLHENRFFDGPAYMRALAARRTATVKRDQAAKAALIAGVAPDRVAELSGLTIWTTEQPIG